MNDSADKPRDESTPRSVSPVIYVVSGGTGSSGAQVVETVRVQFPEAEVEVVKVPFVRSAEEIAAVVARAAAGGNLIVHTLQDPDLRRELLDRSAAAGLATVDLMGDLLQELAALLGQEPLAQPGLYRRLHRAYFDRVEAIEYSIAHDDGQDPRGLERADIILVGVSRAGKTPLSMYLAMQGWKTANIPMVPQVPLPRELEKVDPKRVIGLVIDYEQLIKHRQKRQAETGMRGASNYIEPARVFDEIEVARQEIRRHRFATIDVTNKPIESSAREVVELLTHRLGDAARR